MEGELVTIDDPELLERLADLEHERWSGWMLYQLENLTPENLVRWKRQMVTPYAQLSEREKESDRKEARKSLAVVKAALWP